MYHPTRGGVRGGRDQFKWDDVKVDKHRENYLGHSIKAPVGRWQKGKDLFWYARDNNSKSDQDALKAEIQKVKDEEEQLMREALGLAPKRASRPQGNRLDKHEFSELVKRSSTAEDLGEGHAEAALVHGLGFSRGSRNWEGSSSLQPSSLKETSNERVVEAAVEPSSRKMKEESEEDESSQRKRKREEKRQDKREEKRRDKHEKREKRHAHDSDDKRKHRKNKEKSRHDSD